MPLSSLPLFHRITGQRVVVVGVGPAADAKRRLVERAGGICCAETEAHHAKLAFVVLGDERAAASAAARLRGRGLLVNVTDRPELCDFTVPSILDRDPLLVAIGTGGASAGLAKQVRLRLETLLPQSIGALARGLSAARDAMRARWPDGAERRTVIDQSLAAGSALDPLKEQAPDAVERWLQAPFKPLGSRTVEIVLASDDPDDLTLRHARLLGEADAIVHDPAVPEAILARARADAVRLLVGSESGPISGLTVRLKAAR